MANKKNYTYVIELDTPVWPRKLVEDLEYKTRVAGHVLSVTDLQNDGHIYGRTYAIGEDGEPRPASPGCAVHMPALRV